MKSLSAEKMEAAPVRHDPAHQVAAGRAVFSRLDLDVGHFAALWHNLKVGDRLIRRMEAGEFELIAVGRALITDAHWAAKVRAGDDAALMPFRRDDLARFA